MPRKSPKATKSTEARILQTAIDITSRQGLEKITIGQLAKAMDMSKSGVFAHFGSKETMQLMILDEVINIFIEEVINPARASEDYILIWNYCNHWLSYMERDVFPGGCFLISSASEFSSLEGAVHDKVVESNQNWVVELTKSVQQASDDGHLSPTIDSDQLVFELSGLAIGADWAYKTLGNKGAVNFARRAIWDRLQKLVLTETALPSKID